MAFDSPATYQKKLSLSSPFTYPDRKPKQQALSAELNMNDSFDDFDCSLIEKDALICSQSVTQKNLVDVFGNEEDDSLGLEDLTDDELAEAVRYHHSCIGSWGEIKLNIYFQDEPGEEEVEDFNL